MACYIGDWHCRMHRLLIHGRFGSPRAPLACTNSFALNKGHVLTNAIRSPAASRNPAYDEQNDASDNANRRCNSQSANMVTSHGYVVKSPLVPILESNLVVHASSRSARGFYRPLPGTSYSCLSAPCMQECPMRRTLFHPNLKSRITACAYRPHSYNPSGTSGRGSRNPWRSPHVRWL